MGFFVVVSSSVVVVLILKLLELAAPPLEDNAADAQLFPSLLADEQVLFEIEVEVAPDRTVRGAKAVVDAAAARIIQDEKLDTFILFVVIVFVGWSG